MHQTSGDGAQRIASRRKGVGAAGAARGAPVGKPPHWLINARTGWVALALLSLTLYSAMTPVYFTLVQRVCQSDTCQLTPQQAHALAALGVTVHAYALMNLALNIFFTLVSCVIAAILFWRKPNDWMAQLVGLLLVTLGSNNITGLLGNSAQPWRIPALVIDNLDLAVLILVFTLFPDGRFTPRWSRWLPIGWLIAQLPTALFPDLPIPNWITWLVYLGFFGAVIGAQVYRYWHVSGATQREQTKWVVFGVVVTLIADIALYQPYIFAPALSAPTSLYPVVAEGVFHLITLLIPLSFGFAVLRYRLYDIDIIINKAIVYVSLTTILGAVYLALVIGVERAVSVLTHQDSSALAIVVSTLSISAIFQPLRHRIQTFIDQRFFRSRYDAAQTIEAFSATLRSEVDLSDMREQLLDVIERTMRPAHVSLWLSSLHPTQMGRQAPMPAPPYHGAPPAQG